MHFQQVEVRKCSLLFHDGGSHDIEFSPLICSANQWTGFYIITASVVKELKPVFLNAFITLFLSVT